MRGESVKSKILVWFMKKSEVPAHMSNVPQGGLHGVLWMIPGPHVGEQSESAMAEERTWSSQSLDFYAGSRFLQPLSESSGLQIDQINFIFIEVVALFLAYPFRVQFHPSRCGPVVRHGFELAAGLALSYFCYGYQIWYVIAQSLTCLFLMKSLKPVVMERTVFVVGMAFLLAAHIYRQYTDYGGYTLDITGPLMVNTQRVTSIAFSLADDRNSKHEKLRPELMRQAIRRCPSLLEYFSYIFSFHTAACGPFVFYNDYLAFIEGKNPQPHNKLNALLQERLFGTVTCAMLFMLITPHFPITHLTDPDFLMYGPAYKMLYCLMATTVIRYRYYFAWKLAEAGSINAGLAFNGYDEKGEEKWDMTDNNNVMQIEFSTSLKTLIDNWNIRTSGWLRHTVYYRATFQPTFSVFLVSAVWHGFYPGYFFTFITAILFTVTARQVRRNIRPYFLGDTNRKYVYDALTFATTRIGLAYMCFPFVALELHPALITYKAMYFWLHILAAFTLVLLKLFPLQRSHTGHEAHRTKGN